MHLNIPFWHNQQYSFIGFRLLLGAVQATNHHLAQWCLVYPCIFASLGLNELRVYRCVIHQSETQIYIHYSHVIMGAMTSQITSITIVYSTVYSGTYQRKHQSSASLDFVCGIHRWPVNFPHKWPVTRKMLPFYDVIMTEKGRSSRWQPWYALETLKQVLTSPVHRRAVTLMTSPFLWGNIFHTFPTIYPWIWCLTSIDSIDIDFDMQYCMPIKIHKSIITVCQNLE